MRVVGGITGRPAKRWFSFSDTRNIQRLGWLRSSPSASFVLRLGRGSWTLYGHARFAELGGFYI